MKEDDSGEFWAGSVRRDSCVYEQTRSRLMHFCQEMDANAELLWVLKQKLSFQSECLNLN